MRSWLVALELLLLAILAACASAPRPSAAPAAGPSQLWRQIPQAVTRRGLAHVCPYGPHHAFTARHVVLEYMPGAPVFLLPVLWQQGDVSGVLVPLYMDARRDLAIGYSREAFPHPFVRAPQAPKVGAKLIVATFDWSRSGAPRKGAELEVIDVGPGTLRLAAGRDLSGSSGACLVDRAGQLFGVLHWSAGLTTAVSAGVWGAWSRIDEEWRDTEPYGWMGAPAYMSKPPEPPPEDR